MNKTDASDDRAKRYTIQSISKALDVIELLSQYESLSLLEISDRLQQPKSSLYRIMLTLEQRGYIARSEKTGKYCLGYQLLVSSRHLLENNSLRMQARHEMQRLSEKYGDTVNLGVLERDQVLYLEIIEGTHSLRMNETVGSTAPIHATAIGKAILADMPVEQRDQWLDRQPLAPITPNTITDRELLLKELEKVKKQGYAVDNEESVQGARCIGAAILSAPGRVEGAISISGAIHRYPDDKLPAVAADVMQAAAQISRKMGFHVSFK